LFDLDGVLVDSYDVWFQLINAAARVFGAPAIDRAVFQSGWGQGIHEDVRRFFPALRVETLEAYYHAHFMDHVEALRVDSQAAAVLARLRELDVRVAVITNTPGPLAREILDFAGLEPEIVVGGTDVARAKPAPDMVLRACEQLGVSPTDALVVGDSEYDRLAARAAGVVFAGLGIAGDASLLRLADLLDLAGIASRAG
jgi:HAD superfamily hydrolase (TIGR01549 family)